MIGHFTTFAAAAKQLTDPFTTCQQMGGGLFCRKTDKKSNYQSFDIQASRWLKDLSIKQLNRTRSIPIERLS